MYKSYGALDSRNVIKVAPSMTWGLGSVLMAGANIQQFPLENAILRFEFYNGIADRGRCAGRKRQQRQLRNADNPVMTDSMNTRTNASSTT